MYRLGGCESTEDVVVHNTIIDSVANKEDTHERWLMLTSWLTRYNSSVARSLRDDFDDDKKK